MKLDICRFTYRNGPASADRAYDAMVAYTRKRGVEVREADYGNALIDRARNKALASAREDADGVLFLDDDMVPEPSAAWNILQHADVPVVSALCTSRVAPVELVAKLYDETSDQFIPLDTVKPDRLLIGKLAVGAAFLLMRRSAIDALIEHYLSAGDWLADNRRLLDRLKVRSECREAERRRREEIRRSNFTREKFLCVFDTPTTENELKLGEDICLSRRLIQLGIPVGIDSSIAVGHIGEYSYGPWDVWKAQERKLDAVGAGL